MLLFSGVCETVTPVKGLLVGRGLEPVQDTTDFVDWLLAEITARGWSGNELARRTGVSSAAMSNLLNRQNRPALETCIGIAEALGYPPELVLRKAGLLPPLPGTDDQAIQEVREIMRRLPDSRRQQLREFAWFLLQQGLKDGGDGGEDS